MTKKNPLFFEIPSSDCAIDPTGEASKHFYNPNRSRDRYVEKFRSKRIQPGEIFY